MSRVIAGRLSGRRIRVPAGDATRPTTDRVREAFFSSLVSLFGRGDRPGDESLDGISLLDLYAGSGAVALEAASRGAGPVRCVESDGRTAALIRRNAVDLSVPLEVIRAPVAKVVAEPADHGFDVVWLDPPYDVPTGEVERVVTSVVEQGWLDEDGLVVVERASRSAAPSFGSFLTQTWVRRYGETSLYFAQQEDPQ